MDQQAWDTVGRLKEWLDEHDPAPEETHRTMRVLKLTEEIGEVAQAVMGATGYGPRKGATHTWQDVEAELCDVMLTAMVALRILTPDAQQIFATRFAHAVALYEYAQVRGHAALGTDCVAVRLTSAYRSLPASDE
ncbi:MazG-like family protein [Streptomyces olivoreticuli]